jgi:hypothetical protein
LSLITSFGILYAYFVNHNYLFTKLLFGWVFWKIE